MRKRKSSFLPSGQVPSLPGTAPYLMQLETAREPAASPAAMVQVIEVSPTAPRIPATSSCPPVCWKSQRQESGVRHNVPLPAALQGSRHPDGSALSGNLQLQLKSGLREGRCPIHRPASSSKAAAGVHCPVCGSLPLNSQPGNSGCQQRYRLHSSPFISGPKTARGPPESGKNHT